MSSPLPGATATADAGPANAAANQVIRVFLVDDHSLVLQGLQSILSRESDFEIVGQEHDAERALDSLQEIDTDVVVIDYRLPGMSGVEFCREIAERRIRARPIVLSAFLESDAVEAALMAGAFAYVIKDVESSELKRAIRLAAAGSPLIDSRVAGSIVTWAARLQGSVRPPLTRAQLRVLKLLCTGKSNNAIAKELGISPSAVKKHLSGLFERLDVKSRAEAVASGMRRGLI